MRASPPPSSLLAATLLATLTAPGLVAVPSAVSATVVTDGSLGVASTDLSANSVTITEAHGAAAGGNLFHSFSNFQVPASTTVSFAPTTSFQNTIARVTGGGPSVVGGTISASPSAGNLFLLNRAGWVFQSGSRIDVAGSLHVSTADYLQLGGDRFQSTPLVGEVVSAAAPSAFGFLGAPTGDISVAGTPTLPRSGETLSYSARQVSFAPGVVTSPGPKIGLGARVDIVTAGAAGQYALGTSLPTFSGGRGGSVSFASGGTQYRLSGGQVGIHSGAVSIGQNSFIQVSTGAPSGGLISVVSNSLTLDGGSIVGGGSSGANPGPDVSIDVAGDLLLDNGANLGTYTYTSADAGDITIRAGGDVTVRNKSEIYSQTGQNQSFDDLRVGGATHGGSSSPVTLGDGGAIDVNAQGDVVVEEDGKIYTRTTGQLAQGLRAGSSTLAAGHGLIPGDAGDIRLEGDAVTIRSGGEVFSESILQGGNPGKITIVQRGDGNSNGALAGTLVVQQRVDVPVLGDAGAGTDLGYGSTLTADDAGLRVTRGQGRVSITGKGDAGSGEDDESSD